MKKNFRLFVLLFILLLLTVSTTFSQTAPDKLWDKSFGGDEADMMFGMLPTADGNYLLVGGSLSGVTGDKTEPSRSPNSGDIWIVKMSPSGTKIWDKTYGGSGGDFTYNVIATSDGGFLLPGTSYSGISGEKSGSNKGGNDFWLVKIDAAGNKQWDKTIGGSADDVLYTAVATPDGGYLLGGRSHSDVSGDRTVANQGSYDYWLVKVDASGNKQWDKAFGGVYEDHLQTIMIAADGGYLLFGQSNSPAGGSKTLPSKGSADYWVIKTDASGNKQWEKTYGGNDVENLFSVVATSDGGYLLGGQSASGISGDKTEASKGGADYWIVKIDGTGNIQWDKTFGGSADDILRTLLVTNDGGFLLGGDSRSGISGDKTTTNKGWEDYWLVKIDDMGSKLWDKSVGGNDEDFLYSLNATADGGYLLGGYSYSSALGEKTAPNKGGRDYWVVKLGTATTIATGLVSPLDYCAGSLVKVPYTTTGNFTTGNVFTVQLSNEYGLFTNPVNIGTLSSVATTGTINAILPATVTEGNDYRVRVIASNPAVAGTDNGISLSLTPNPVATINGKLSACAGSTVSLNATTSPNVNYSWTGVNGFNALATQIDLNNITTAQAGKYTLIASRNGCADTTSVNVAVNPLPLAYTGNDTLVCAGSPVTLGATAVSGNTYSWTSSPTGFSSTSSKPTVNPVVTTNYTLTETTTATTCANTKSVVVSTNQIPGTPVILPIAGAPVTFCEGGLVTLGTSASSGAQWYKDGVIINNAVQLDYQAKVSGVYTVTTTLSGCTSSPSAGVTVTVKSLPAVPTITAAGNVLSSSAASGNQWYVNGNIIAGATSQTYTATTSGNYAVTVNVNGCSSTSPGFNYAVTGIVSPATWNGEVVAYPNPASKSLFIKNTGIRKLQLELIDLFGRKVYTGNLSVSTGTINLDGLANGIYQLRATDLHKKETIVLTIVKQ